MAYIVQLLSFYGSVLLTGLVIWPVNSCSLGISATLINMHPEGPVT